MKPTTTIPNDLLDNRSAFTDPFYDQFKLRPDARPLHLTPGIAKNYLFPTFYGDVTSAIGIFMCSYEAAHKLMPHPDMKPISMGGGGSLVVISCYEYKQVLGVAPYNEIAMTIPLMIKPAFNIPVLPMVANIFKNFGYYVFSMPVTSLENQIRGVKIWGLPKVVQEIDLREEGSDCVVAAMDETGAKYFGLTVPTGGKPTDFDVKTYLYTAKDGNFLQSETRFRGRFNVVKHMDALWSKGKAPDRQYLTIGHGPAAETLRRLKIDPNPFQFRFAKHVSSCFDLPNPTYQSPLTA